MKENLSEKEYIEKYKEICSHCDRYANQINVKIHNRAVAKLDKMNESIKDNLQFAKKVYYELLNDEDEIVRRVAATYCLHDGIHIDEAIDILTYLSDNAKNVVTRVAASGTLFMWEYSPEVFK